MENEFFGLKKGQDLEDRAAHVCLHQEFPGVPEEAGGEDARTSANGSTQVLAS